MLLSTQNRVYDRSYEDFTLHYYLTTKMPDEADPTQPVPYYGVLLKKISKSGEEVEQEYALLSESEEATLQVLHALHKLEVTPMSFLEVIDAIAERFLFDTV